MKAHDDAVVQMLKDDPEMAVEYLRAAMDELDEDGGMSSFLCAVRHVIEAQGGMATIARKTKLNRESLYRAFSPEGNPTVRTMQKVIKATGIRFHDLTQGAA